MRTNMSENQGILKQGFLVLFSLLVCCNFINAYPALGDDGREYAGPGAHQLASWLAAQLRRGDYIIQPQEIPVLPYRLPAQGKRNSELTNSMMGLPRNMIDNGKK